MTHWWKIVLRTGASLTRFMLGNLVCFLLSAQLCQTESKHWEYWMGTTTNEPTTSFCGVEIHLYIFYWPNTLPLDSSTRSSAYLVDTQSLIAPQSWMCCFLFEAQVLLKNGLFQNERREVSFKIIYLTEKKYN